jgi:hypothetical protein
MSDGFDPASRLPTTPAATIARRMLIPAVESAVARELFRSLEPCHGIVYVAAERAAVYGRLGLEPGAMWYFATRAAALGRPSAELVRATFYDFFSPHVVHGVIPEAWRRAAPSA